MNLIFVTRKIDRGDALSGFVFTWLAELTQYVDKLEVICLEKGDTSGLPANVEIFSMGKEKGKSRFRELVNYLKLLFRLVPKSDGVFIHMHPIYAIVAWLPAVLFRKKMILWYTHKSVDFKLRVAYALVDRVLTASPESFRLPSKKVKIVGHGIDLEKFTPTSSPPVSRREIGGEREGVKFRIVSIGRISPVKDYETFLKAVEILVNHQGLKDLEVKIYGKIGLPQHEAYLDSLVEFVQNAELENYIKFEGEVNYDYVDEVYHEAALFVNLSQTGSIDKTVLEAAASGIIVLTSNEAFIKQLKAISPLLLFERNNPADLARKILQVRALSEKEQLAIIKRLRMWVEKEHNLKNLVQRIIAEYQV